MKRFAVFDIDGTLFRWQLFHELVSELIASGHLPAEAKKDIDKKIADWRARSHTHAFTEYEHAVVNAFRPHIAGVKVEDIESAADKILSRSGKNVYVYTRSLIEELRKKGYMLIAISGSQHEIVSRFAALWQFDIALGQVNDSVDGTYTGTIPDGKLVVMRKGELLQKIVDEHGLSWKDSVGVGDSLSDAGMLERVERPIAFNPNDSLFAAAKQHSWKVVIERKNMIYELEQKNGTYVLVEANSR
jgi:HAD superfamily hydrolase (TIGR01490 family)